MKDKHLYQRRIDGDYKGYTEDSFYFNSTLQQWCWKQTSTGNIFRATSISELKKIKNKHYIGYGNHKNHAKDATLNNGLIGTDDFAKLIGIEKNYISRLLSRANTQNKNFNMQANSRRKRGIVFINCLKEANIDYEQVKYKWNKRWVFKNITENKIKEFKKRWLNYNEKI